MKYLLGGLLVAALGVVPVAGRAADADARFRAI